VIEHASRRIRILGAHHCGATICSTVDGGSCARSEEARKSPTAAYSTPSSWRSAARKSAASGGLWQDHTAGAMARILRSPGGRDGVGVTGRRGFRPGPVLPNSHLLVGLGGAVDGAGWITTDHTGRTTVPGVWAAGAGAVVTGHALVAFYDSIFLLSQGFIPAVNALLLGSLLYQSRLVPRAGTRQAVCHDLNGRGPSSPERRNPPRAWIHSGDMAEFFDAVERAQLGDLLDELGPTHPPCLTRERPVISPRTWSSGSATPSPAPALFCPGRGAASLNDDKRPRAHRVGCQYTPAAHRDRRIDRSVGGSTPHR
jgi:hypothetical protein